MENFPAHRKRFAMARPNKTGRAKHANFIGIPRFVHGSAAWKHATPYERVVYIEIRAMYRGKKNQLSASIRWLAMQCGISKNTVEKALRGLVEKGLIARSQVGYLGPEGRGVPTLYRLTDAADDLSAATLEFTRWQPAEKQKPVPAKGTPRPKARDSPHKSGIGMH